MEHTASGNSTLVFDLAALHFHMRSSHGFSMLVWSGLEGGVRLNCSSYFHLQTELPPPDRGTHEQVPH